MKNTYTDMELANFFCIFIKQNVKEDNVTTYGVENDEFTRKQLEETSFNLSSPFACITDDTPDMSPAAWKLVRSICKELVYGNYLWHYVADSGTMRGIIKELRELKILHKTSSPDIHIVNPVYIRKGHPIDVAENTNNCIALHHKACIEAIMDPRTYKKSLRMNKKALPFSASKDTNLLEEDPAPYGLEYPFK